MPNPLLGNGNLVAIFLDLDLSILGAPECEYKKYAKQIRREYGQYPLETYCRGRVDVLKSFLERERMYFSDYFYGKYEERARENIQQEIQSLQDAIN